MHDQEFRIRMIENHDGDALADEDHTHRLTVQEYFHDKNKWWLHSNKQALSTVQRLQQEAGEEPHVPSYSYKHKQWEAQSYHLAQNYYSFDALQFDRFRINIKL